MKFYKGLFPLKEGMSIKVDAKNLVDNVVKKNPKILQRIGDWFLDDDEFNRFDTQMKKDYIQGTIWQIDAPMIIVDKVAQEFDAKAMTEVEKAYLDLQKTALAWLPSDASSDVRRLYSGWLDGEISQQTDEVKQNGGRSVVFKPQFSQKQFGYFFKDLTPDSKIEMQNFMQDWRSSHQKDYLKLKSEPVSVYRQEWKNVEKMITQVLTDKVIEYLEPLGAMESPVYEDDDE